MVDVEDVVTGGSGSTQLPPGFDTHIVKPLSDSLLMFPQKLPTSGFQATI